MSNPYTDRQIKKNVFERVFKTKVENDELVWHRDKRSRFVTVLEGTGWKVQFDNELPKNIVPGTTIHINKNSYHRLLKGDSDLIVRIIEL